MNHNNINVVLKYLCNLKKISEAELARETNLFRNTINMLKAGKTADPRISTLQPIAKYFHITIDQLLGASPINETTINIQQSIKPLPVLPMNSLSCFNLEDLLSEVTLQNHHHWITYDQSFSEANFAVTLTGDGMWPQFQEGSILIISSDKQPKNRDFVVVKMFETEEIIFRKVFMENGKKILQATNSIFPPIFLSTEDKIIGVVVETRIQH